MSIRKFKQKERSIERQPVKINPMVSLAKIILRKLKEDHQYGLRIYERLYPDTLENKKGSRRSYHKSSFKIQELIIDNLLIPTKSNKI
ncbi:MAG: hypothetical protein ACTSRI_19985 [Promethearchaeota archaeon]